MKVLHVIPAIARKYGGPSSVMRAMCCALADAQIEVELLTTDAGLGRDELASCGFPCPVHLHPVKGGETWKYSPRSSKWLQRNIARFDLVHIHALWSYTSQAAARISAAADIPYIIRPAGMIGEYSFACRRLQKALYWLLRERSTVSRAARIHTTSIHEKNDVLKRVPLSNVEVIPNGVEQDAWSVKARQMPQRSRPQILFLSRIHPVKGITDLLLPAFEQMDVNAQLNIAGGADPHSPAYYSQVVNRIENSHRSRDINLMGPIQTADRWKLFDQADLFVLPSHSENFGVVVAEAMARACAVVVTEKVQSCDHVRQAKSGLVVPLDPVRLAAGFDDLLSNANRLHDAAMNGKRYAKKTFDWNNIANDIVEMYESTLETRAA